MGKRSSFDRLPRDFYVTPMPAVVPLLPHLARNSRFIEPCAGDGALVRHLESAGHICVRASDIEPMSEGIESRDVSSSPLPMGDAEMFITNPPWGRPILHGIIDHLPRFAPTWLLFDADWVHTKQSAPYVKHLRKIVSVGRVKWIPDSKMTGKDNCAWHLFDAREDGGAVFFGRSQ